MCADSREHNSPDSRDFPRLRIISPELMALPLVDVVPDSSSSSSSGSSSSSYCVVLLLSVVVAASFPQSFPSISINFRPERPNFHSQGHFLVCVSAAQRSLRPAEISVTDRGRCARQRSLCAAEISSVRRRDLCARQRSLWAAEERARPSGAVWTRSTRTTWEVWAGELGNFVIDIRIMLY